jgi:hypothetical protein
MSDFDRVQDLNEQLARRIHEEAKRDPHSPYIHKYVGIANGRDVVIADDLEDIGPRLQQIEPDPDKCFCFWVDPDLDDYNAANEIWGLH